MLPGTSVEVPREVVGSRAGAPAAGGEATSVLVYAVGSVAVLVCALLGAPMVGGALNRGAAGEQPTYCRNNSTGFLLGCGEVRAHKTQKLSVLWWTSAPAARRREGVVAQPWGGHRDSERGHGHADWGLRVHQERLVASER